MGVARGGRIEPVPPQRHWQLKCLEAQRSVVALATITGAVIQQRPPILVLRLCRNTARAEAIGHSAGMPK